MSVKLRQFDPRAMAGGGGKAAVAGHQWRLERLGQRNIGSVIGRQVVPQLPYARQQEIMRISPRGKVGQIRQGYAATLALDFSSRSVTADDLRNFDIEQVRRVERLAGREQPVFNGPRGRGLEKRFDQRRRVDNDHVRSRSARTASAGATDGLVSVRPRRRARNSSSVGRSAAWRISLSR